MPRIRSLLLIYSSLYFCSYGNGLSYDNFLKCEKPYWFRCHDKECVPFSFECDGFEDCNDGSDEFNCTDFTLVYPHNIICTIDEFKCKNNNCIPQGKFCDAVKDCTDGSDEYDGCVNELKCDDKFRCNDKYCVRKNWVCDGKGDCPDGSDEWNCDNKTLSASECEIANNGFFCKNQRCISFDVVCNEKDDCGDGSDEGATCKLLSDSCDLIASKCSYGCKQTPSGPVCICKSGYVINHNINNYTCTDIDECQIYGKCDQGCVNTAGSYKCTCERGYILQDDMKTCKADGGEATLVFSTETEIRAVYLDSKIYFTAAANLSHAIDVAVDDEDYLYCSDVMEDSVQTIVKGMIGGKHEAIVTAGLNRLSGIAVDWITGNIYFTDEGNQQIGICNTNGTYCTILISGHIKPSAIALLPTNGIMFWCNVDRNPHIEMAGMDGKDNSLFITEKLEWPTSITIDHPNNRLYWLDSKANIVESVRLDGTDRRIILRDVIRNPFSLAVFENKLYWSDWHDNTIQSCDKFSGKDWRIVSRADIVPYGIHIYHSALKPKIPNPCHSNPCSQLCMLNRNKNYTCGCTIDKELKADNQTCREAKKKQHFIIITGNLFIDYFHEFLGKPQATTSTTFRYITAATYDSHTGTILASDKRTNQIIRYDPNSGIIKNLIPFENKILGGMAFDHIGNNLYLSNEEDRTIEVHSLTTMTKTVFYFKDQPCDIALAPEEGTMFIVFRYGISDRSYRLDKMKMNGIGSGNLIRQHFMGPTVSLHYDRDKKTLFSIDENSGYIMSYQAEDQHLLRTGLKKPVSLTAAGDNIFWTQRDSNLLYWTDYEMRNVYSFHKQVAFRMSKSVETPLVIALHNIVTHEERGCQKNNGNCSHVCLPSSAILFTCACPPGMMLSANNRTCTLQSACLADEIKCSEHDICIKRQQWCDGNIDCPNSEDEENDCGETGTCEKGQFMCKDGTCINSKDRCNFNNDCPDKSDEEGCPTQQCRSNEFQCRDGTCISNSLECDGYNDCSDFSDEINNNCNERTCPPSKFMCKDGRTCIPKEWECDGERDCSDGSDEIGDECKNVNICGDGKFKCNNGRCISSSLKCNGINDCGDETDERHCLNEKFGHNCTKDEYLCFNTDICLPKKVRCNGVQDCPKNDDEHRCAYCFNDEFACDNQRCIPQSWVCDKTDDCGDKSDEKDCGGNKWRNANVNTSNVCEEFKCAMGTCLPFSKVCDGIRDCPDNSDENGGCTISCAYHNVCKHLCYKTPLGGVCGCQTGYRLATDMVSCDDINECELDVCSQICRNTVGSFQCSCYDGYVIRSDRVSCKAIGPPMELITVTDDDIRKISSNLLSIEAIHSLTGLSITGFDANALDNAIYWSNDQLGTINKINIKTNELSTFTDVGNPGVIAVDWITNNIYFNDNDRPNMIKVCNLNQQNCAIMVKIEGAAKVASLIIDPKNRWLFWSQTTWQVHDKPFSEICRTDMMGTNMKIIGFQDIGVVSGMAIDHIKARLYWSDSFSKTIESSNLDGSQRRTFLNTDMHQPLGINIFENSLYWLMGSNGQLQKCKLYGNRSCEIMNIGPNNVHKHFAILHISRHPLVENLCEKLNCNYMCVLKANDATCICQDGKPITSNSTCTEVHTNNEMRFATRRTNISRMRHQGGIYSITIVTLLIIVSLLCIYYYYQKRKLKLKTLNDLNSIRFQNPSYDRRDEVAVTLGSLVPHVSPGQHEYTNPINDNLLKAAMESSVKKSERSICQSEKHDEEKQNACLISFTRSK